METHFSAAAQVLISLIPIVGIVFAGTVIFFALLWHHRENSLKIRQGQSTPREYNLKASSLFIGLCLIAVGLVLTVMFALLQGLSYILLGGLIPLAIGIVCIIFYKINPDFKK